ncbi:ATP-grasp domain-containing protein [Aurantiacibacter aquimixticola]|uniref:ATP-grasp domain-containing protein n=1 Tax=Aurantiacibacter aquimixticola TaxID=1958945 RepID=A0A419RSJ4_9SPHN|nr:hypothetical protein [Aurantiacibacter aquimixticola]RJY08739.1 hypothetical protein D6201_04640 [Aurantiacibacter aquimixticola]
MVAIDDGGGRVKIIILKLDSEKKEWAGGTRTGLSYVEMYEKILSENAIPFQTVRFGQEDFWEQALSATHFIARFKGYEPDLSIGHSILPPLEAAGVKCLPEYDGFRFCGDKLRIAAFYAANDIDAPRTDAVFSMEDVERWKAERGFFPVVGKLRHGASSINVEMIHDAAQLDRIAERLFTARMVDGRMDPGVTQILEDALLRRPAVPNTGLLLQEFAPGNDGDHRVTTIGDRAFYFKRSNRPGDFRASGSGIFDYDPDKADKELIAKSFEISKRFGFSMMAYDYLTQPRPMLVEMNYAAVGAAIAGAPGYFTPEGKFVSHDNRPPQWYQLVDFLELPDLKTP